MIFVTAAVEKWRLKIDKFAALYNYKFIDRIQPAKVAIGGLCFYLAVFLLTPAHVSIHLSVFPFIYILLCYVSFIAGTVVIRFKKKDTRPNLFPEQYNAAFYLSLILAVAGIALRLYDRIHTRGASFAMNMYENRSALDEQSSGSLSALASVLFPLVYFNYFWMQFSGQKSRFLRGACTLMFFYPILDALLIGSRFPIFHNIIMYFLIRRINNKKKLTARQVITLGISAVLLVFLLARLIEERLAFGNGDFDFDFTYVLHISDYNFTFSVDRWYEEFINSGPNTWRTIKFLYLHIGQYISHGIFEFNYLWQHYNLQGEHYWGGQHFYNFLRVLPLVNLDAVNEQILFPRPGVYVSFFGDVFVDFGWLGLLFMFGWGVLNKYLWTKVAHGKVLWVPMYLFVVFIVFFMPTVNLIVSGMGIIFLTSLSVPLIFHHFKKIIWTVIKPSVSDNGLEGI